MTEYIGPIEGEQGKLEIRVEQGEEPGELSIEMTNHDDGESFATAWLNKDQAQALVSAVSAWLASRS